MLEKYERRGSKFVTFRVEAINQRGEKAAEYDYTCIFEYGKGQRSVPAKEGDSQAATPQLVSSGLLDFEKAFVGDVLNELAITESQEIMNRKNDFRLAGRRNDSNIHTDEEFAKQTEFGQRIVNSLFTLGLTIGATVGDTTLGTTIANLGMTDVRFPKPVFHGDTIHSVTKVLAKREGKSRPDAGIVTFEHFGYNQRDEEIAYCKRAGFMRKRPA